MAIDLYLLLKIPRESHPKGIEQAIDAAYAMGKVDNKLLVTARKVLLNPDIRKEYDRRLALTQAEERAARPKAQAAVPAFQTQTFQPAAVQTSSFAESATAPVNPYRAPQAEVNDVAAGDGAVEGKLFTAGGIGIATFFGTLIAGGILLAHNYRRLGESRKATLALLSCIALTVGVIVALLLLPEGARFGIAVPEIIGIMAYVRSKQGGRIEAHRDADGVMASNWLAAGIGILTGLVVFTVLFVVLFVLAIGSIAGMV